MCISEFGGVMDKQSYKLNRNSRLLIGTNLINNILYLFLNTFMVAYFFTLTNYDYKLISIYYVIIHVFLGLCFVVLGNLVKSKHSLTVFRVGIILHALYVLLVIFLKEKIVDYYLYLGIFYGIVQGTYWSSGHTLITKATSGNSAKSYVSVNSILTKIFKIFFPFVFGASIAVSSFSTAGAYVLVLSLFQLILSLLLKQDVAEANEKFDLIAYVKVLKENKLTNIKSCYRVMFYEGIVKYLLETLITIVIVMTFKTALNLGILTTIFAICSIFTVYFFHRYYKNREPKKIFTFCSIFLFLGVLLMVIDINTVTVIIYNFVISICMTILINYASMKRYNCLDTDFLKKYTVEHQAIADIYMAISRILGYFVLFLVSFSDNIIYFKGLLIVITFCFIVYTRELRKI